MSQLQLWTNFSKRANSTLTPAASADVFNDVVLKENTSIMHPHFIVSNVNWSWNYAWFEGRYYYIVDIVSRSNYEFELICELDYLSTFKTEIGNYETLISRASNSSAWDARVIDTIYSAKMVPQVKETLYSAIADFTLNRLNGTYILGTVGHLGQKFYMLSADSFASFCHTLFPSDINGNENWANWIVNNLSNAMAGGVSSITENIAFIKWLPIHYSLLTDIGQTPTSYVSLGFWDFLVSPGTGGDFVREITGNYIHTILQSSISFVPRSDVNLDFYKYLSPYAQYQITAPGFGVIPIDGQYLFFGSTGADRAYISVDYNIDILTGNAVLTLGYPGGSHHGVIQADKPIGRYTTNLAFDVKAGGSSFNLPGVLASTGAAIAAIATENYAGAIGAIGSAVSATIPQNGQIGGGISGPMPDLTAQYRATAVYYDIITENNDELGRPVGDIFKIKNIPGFVQTARAKLALPGHTEEMNIINNLLDSGIFYE